MRNFLKTLSFAFFFCASSQAADIDISTTNTTAQTFSSNGQALNVTSGGNLSTSTSVSSITDSLRTGNIISVDSGDATKGIINTNNGANASAIGTSGTGVISSITLTTGLISSGATGQGTINFAGGGTTDIIVGQASGSVAAKIQTTASSNNAAAIYTSGSTAMDLSITVNATGTISSDVSSTAKTIYFNKTSSATSSLTVNNSGTISAGSSSQDAVFLGTSTHNTASITNAGTVLGKISAGSGILNVTNNTGGTITGNISLGSDSSSFLTMSGGTVNGTVTFGNSAQNFTIDGGTFNGFVVGGGNLIVNSNSTFSDGIGLGSNHIGNAINSLTVGDGVTLDYGSGNSSSALSALGNVTIGDSSTVYGNTAVTSGNINGDVVIGAGSDFSFLGTIGGNISGATNSTLSLTNNASAFAGNISGITNLNLDVTNPIFSGTVDATNIVFAEPGNYDTYATFTGAVTTNDFTLGAYNYATFSDLTANNITLNNGSSLLLNNGTVSATSITLNNDSSFEVTGATINSDINTNVNYLSLGGSTTNGNITLSSNATLDTDAATIINGTVNGSGYLSVNGALVTNGNIGDSVSLSGVDIYDVSLDLSVNNNSLSANQVTIYDSNGSLTIGSATVAADIISHDLLNNSAFGTGSVIFAANNTLGGDIEGVLYDPESFDPYSYGAIGSVNINSNASIDAGSYNIFTQNLTLGSGSTLTTSGDISAGVLASDFVTIGQVAVSLASESNLTLDTGSSFKGTVDGAVAANNGSLTINSGATLTSITIGGTNALNNLILGASANQTFTTAIKTRNLSLGSGASLSTSAAINGGGSNYTSISLASGSNLTLNSGSSINARINGNSAGQGSLTISNVGNLSLATYGVGTTNKLDSIIINSGSDVSFGTTGSKANSLTIASGASAEFYGGGTVIDNVTVNGSITFDTILSGAITVNDGGTINVPYSFNNVTTNSLTVNSGGILAFSIDGNSSGSITATGIASLSANTTLKLTITGTLTLGHAYTVLSGGSGSSLVALANNKINVNSSGTNSYSGSALVSSVSGNDLILTVSSEEETPPASSPSFTNPNQQVAYNNISSIASPTGSLSTLKDYVTSDSNSTEQKSAALDSALTQNNNFANRIIFNNINTSLDLASKRIQSLAFNSGISSGEESANKNKAVWGGIFGANARQGNTSFDNGYNANTNGIELGYDKKLDNHDIILGISGSYASSNVKAINALKQTSISSYQANLYAGYAKDNYFTNGFIGFVWNDYKSSRHIPTTSSLARGNYNGQSYVARIESGFNQKLREGFVISPTITITAAENNISDYNEDGAGTLNLNVKTKSISFFEARSGLNLSNSFKTKNDLIIKPEIFASYGYDFAGSKQKTSSNFIGQSSTINTSAANIAKGSWKTGVGLKIYGTKDVSVSGNYTVEHRQNYLGNSGELRLRVGF